MPTPEANTSSPPPSESSLVALRNPNITELATAEADSFKANNANVSIMTQDRCLDNGHQAISNERSSTTDDKVSDDLNNSINSVVSNGVNSVQEFNVDVNRDREHENSTDLVIVQNHTVDTDSPPTGKVSPSPPPTTTSNINSTETPSEFVDNSKDNFENNSINNIDANISEYSNNNIVEDMTVIKHQNSGENIREIIANSDKANKNSNDSQLVDKVVNSDNNDQKVSSRSARTRRSRKLTRSDNVNDEDQIEDPIERLNKLRASISSALSEVKGVLKQYSTEQSLDEQNESTPSSKPDEGPVRFRFVRKIRRRSVFSEDDETEIPKTTLDVITSPIIENKVIEEVPTEIPDSPKVLSSEDQKLPEPSKDENQQVPPKEEEKSIQNNNQESDKKQQIKTATDIQIAPETSDNSNVVVSEFQKTSETHQDPSKADDVEAPPTTTISETPKTKIVKTKKVLKKDSRRASIAAVEINQISADEQSSIPVELKTQRRPSDSGTLVKQTTRTKVKTSEKPKVISSRKARTNSSSKTEKVEATSSPTAADKSSSPKTEKVKIISTSTEDKSASPKIEKVEATSSPTEEKSSSPKTEKVKINSTSTEDKSASPKTEKVEATKEKSSSPKETNVKTASPSEDKPSSPITEKVEPVFRPTEDKPSSPKENSTKILEENKSSDTTASVTLPQSNQETIKESPVIVESTTLEATNVSAVINQEPHIADLLSDVPILTPAPELKSKVNSEIPQAEAVTKLEESVNTPESAPAALEDSSALKSESLQESTESDKPAEISEDTSRTSEAISDPAASSRLDDDLLHQSSPKVIESDKPTETSADKLSSPETTTVPSDNSTMKATDKLDSPTATTAPIDLSKVIAVLAPKPLTIVKPIKIEQPVFLQQKLKMVIPGSKVEVPKPQAAKSKPSPQAAKSGIPVKKTNTPTSSAKIPVASPASAKVDASKTNKNVTPVQTKKTTEALTVKAVKTVQTAKNENSGETSPGVEAEEPLPANVPKDAIAVKFNLPGQQSVEELQRLEDEQGNKETSPSETTEAEAAPKKKRKAKKKVVIRRIRRKLSKDDTFLNTQEGAAELEVCEKEIEEEEPEEEVPDVPKQPKSCLKVRQFEIGDVVMYAEHYKKTQVRWKKGVVTERITSISYKINIDGDERPAHVSYIKKFTDRKVNFGGKEYLEIDYAQIESDEEKERNYSIWNCV
ncbi:mucin-2 [Episyrphus balteatus]|uniref:mucin-2 n=1 Tax=Episyrphus balteatus TaxID=286459 RepID=UPI0024858177|nr:mucin-2 [Episyrphus balteatus]